MALALPVAALALAACGSSRKHAAAATHTKTSATTLAAHTFGSGASSPPSGLHGATLTISSSAPYPHGGIDPRYTCHGQDVSPPVKWHGVSAVAPHAKEMLFFVRTVSQGKVETDWAVAGMAPSIGGINAGETPPGAVVGRNSSGSVGYHLCPPAGALLTMAAYAVGHKLNLKPGFDPESARATLESAETQWGGLTFSAYPPPK